MPNEVNRSIHGIDEADDGSSLVGKRESTLADPAIRIAAADEVRGDQREARSELGAELPPLQASSP